MSRYFVAYLTSFVAVAPFFRTKDPRVALRTNKFFNNLKALYTLAGVEDKDLSVFLNCKSTAWYLLFPPVHSPNCIDDSKRTMVAEGPEEEDACDVNDADVLHPMLSDDEDEDESGARNKPNLHSFSCCFDI